MLVVDDEASVRLGCVIALRSDGFHTTGEGSSRAALERLVARGERYDVLVIDYAMPESNGLELIAALDPATRPPILLASAHAEGAVICAALKLGVWDFQAKPLVPDELRRRVRRLLTRSQDGTEPKAWLARALGHCQRCAWAEALKELQAWPESEHAEPAALVTGLVHQMSDDIANADVAFKRARWHPGWAKAGGEIWPELARRLG
ncbi:MAG: response regulator [Undibacterium sp.]|nr:response regulator [Opitutaceae bacterium]